MALQTGLALHETAARALVASYVLDALKVNITRPRSGKARCSCTAHSPLRVPSASTGTRFPSYSRILISDTDFSLHGDSASLFQAVTKEGPVPDALLKARAADYTLIRSETEAITASPLAEIAEAPFP